MNHKVYNRKYTIRINNNNICNTYNMLNMNHNVYNKKIYYTHCDDNNNNVMKSSQLKK